jgi:hypothetical protein
MGSAKVTLKEIDLSTIVPGFAGISGAIVLPAVKGNVMKPTLITNEGQLIDVFGKPDPKKGLSFYSALSFLTQSNKLWVIRPDTNALYPGIKVKDNTADKAFEALTEGVDNPDIFDDFADDDSFLIVSANPGKWGESISVAIEESQNYENAFVIKVYESGVELEAFEVSKKYQKDGYGKQMYLEDVINGKSAYIRVKDNELNETDPKIETSPNSLTSGSDGDAPTISNYIKAIELIQNPEEYDVVLLMDGGVTDVTYQQKLVEIAKKRIGTFAILSTPPEAEISSNYLNDLVQFRRDTNINDSFGGMFTPHTKVYDKFNDIYVYIAPDGLVGASMAYTARTSEMWVPSAGWDNGSLKVVDLTRTFTEGERDVLYDNQINPIRKHPKKGIAIWGNKTLQSKPSALDRINVRMLLMVIEPTVMDFLDYFEFKINDAMTRLLIKTGVESAMNDIKARRGVYDFMVVCDETNNTPIRIDRNELYLDLYIKPTKSAEFITFRSVITTTGADFNAVKLK